MVITVDAWAENQVSELSNLLTSERQVMARFSVQELDAFAPTDSPVFVVDSPEGHFYGFPEYGVPGFKFAKFRHEPACRSRCDEARYRS